MLIANKINQSREYISKNYFFTPFILTLITLIFKQTNICQYTIPNYLLIHTFLELFCVAIGLMTFVLFWGIKEKKVSNITLIISFSFLMIAIIDLFHILTYAGMPNFFKINAINSAIYFWIISRIIQSTSLLIAASIAKKKVENKHTIIFFGIAFLIIGLSLIGIGIFSHKLPIFYDDKIGMTDIKIYIEIICSIICLISGYIFSKKNEANFNLFAKSSGLFFCMSIAFISYQNPHDLMNFWGHILKSVSYVLIFLNLVQLKLISPYIKIEAMNIELQSKIQSIKLLESELERSRKIASLGSEVRGMAHDLNNVLMIISNSANSILKIDAIKENELLQNKVMQIKKATNRSHDFLKSLLKFSKNVSTEKEDILIPAVFYDFEKHIIPLIPSNIKLNFASPIDHTISFPKTDLEQILFNLIVNARDAIDDRIGEISIKSYKKTLDNKLDFLHYNIPAGEYICISVEDNGCGISENVISKIFEPFFTTKESGKGNGIGLATVLSILQKNHSYIIVESKLDLGTKFELYFSTTNLDHVIEFNELNIESIRRIV